MKRLGVNIDHVATLRQARGTTYPDVVKAALIAEQAGADLITVHLREDRRHIQEQDVENILKVLKVPVNLEMAVTPFMIEFALKYRPAKICLVPEKRQELTTEGGLDVRGQFDLVRDAVMQLSNAGMEVSLFIDPDFAQIDAAKKTGAPVIEIHTGAYADAQNPVHELKRIQEAAIYAEKLGLIVNAGHGLHCENTAAVAAIPQIHELNIGHSIVADALFVGMAEAVKRIKSCL